MVATHQLFRRIQADITLRYLYFGTLNWFKRNGGALAPINVVLEIFGVRLILASSKQRTKEKYLEMKKDSSIEKWNKLRVDYRMYKDFPDPVDQEYKVYLMYKQRNQEVKVG